MLCTILHYYAYIYYMYYFNAILVHVGVPLVHDSLLSTILTRPPVSQLLERDHQYCQAVYDEVAVEKK